ncbi:MAG: PaaI family thioesterase [Actinomycetota bacterium]
MATEANGFRKLPSHYDRCFGCGRDHPTGLHLEMWGMDEELRVRGSFTVTEHHQGAPGLAHGGVISAAVDEGMGYLLWLVGSPAVTAHLDVDFRRPVAVGSRLELEARVERQDGRKIWASLRGRVDDEVAVEARALYLMVGLDHFAPHAERMGERLAERPYNP